MPIAPPAHLPIRENWLAKHREEVLEPEIPIIDAHHHLWDRPTGRYLADDLQRDIGSGHRIVSTVYVQCQSMLKCDGPVEMRPVGEVEFANGVAAMFASGIYGPARCCNAIIGGADLSLGRKVCPVLEHMIEVSGGRLRGIRNPLAWHESEMVRSSSLTPACHLMSTLSFRQGVKALTEYGLTLDVWVYHTQLGSLFELARETPEVVIVIDHFGGPVGVGPHAGKSVAVERDWSASLARLAMLPNTRIKLGGAGMNVFGFTFAEREYPPSSEELAAAWLPYFETCIDLFGVERCMFESNFPVDKGMFSYSVLWNAFKRLAGRASHEDKTALFSRTAARTYRIPVMSGI